MFRNIIFLFVGLFVQEVVTLNALIFATHEGWYSPLLIHTLFVATTIIDIIIGFLIGKYLKKKTFNAKITTSIQKMSACFLKTTNQYQRWFGLFLLGNLSFPYVNSCIAGYLDLPFWESSLFIFLGDIVYYICLWLLILGITSIIKNLYLAFGIVAVLMFIVIVISKKVRRI
jgi:membrane protein YqaA with SNARE-associated domain